MTSTYFLSAVIVRSVSLVRRGGLALLIGSLCFGCTTLDKRHKKPKRETPAAAAPVHPVIEPRPFSPTERSVAIATLQHWSDTLRDPACTYELDPFDRRITSRMRTAVAALFPATPPEGIDETHHFTISIDRVELPFGNYAYVTTRVSNRFSAHEYADVFLSQGDAWTLLDHYQVANTMLTVVLTDFSWESYCREHGLQPPAQTDPAGP